MPNRVDSHGQYLYTEGPSDNVVVNVTLAAPGAGQEWVIDQIDYGYDVAPAVARELQIWISGLVFVRLPVAAVGSLTFVPRMTLKGDNNGEVIVRLLASGTAGRSGYLNVFCRVHRIGNE